MKEIIGSIAVILGVLGVIVLVSFGVGLTEGEKRFCEDLGYTYIDGTCYTDVEPLQLPTLTP